MASVSFGQIVKLQQKKTLQKAPQTAEGQNYAKNASLLLDSDEPLPCCSLKMKNPKLSLYLSCNVSVMHSGHWSLM